MNSSTIEAKFAGLRGYDLRTDDTLHQDELLRLETHVRRRLGGRIRDFRIHIEEAGLILEGFVATYYAKQLAQHAVMEATERSILANEIEVA